MQKNDSLWTNGTSIGEFFRQKIAGLKKPYDVAYGNYEYKGHNYIGLTYQALGPSSGDREDFGVVLIHSLIHTGGKGGEKTEGSSGGGLRNAPFHDLKYLGEKYKDILKYCTKRGGSKLLDGQ